MLSTITGLKEDLAKLAGVLNQFKSETVQVKLLEQFLAIGPAPGTELVNPVATTKPRRGRPPKAEPGTTAAKPVQAKRSKRSAMGATGALNVLMSQGFFKTKRSISDITAACESKAGVRIKVTNLSGPLARFVQDGKLKRAKNKDDKFEYWGKS